ncbi:MAG TPA: MFS transporter [Syntrophomonas sp.]|nr:MFS transporter [Syntrophomonas sp.]
MKNNNRTLTKLAIICLSLTDCGTGATTAALPTISAGLPGVPFSLIQWIASVPVLMIGFAPTLCYAPLVRIMKKRSILYIGVILFMIGGLGPAWLNFNIYIILVQRAILGLGIGILTPMGIDLIYDFYKGHEQRTMIGFSGACIGLSGMLFTMIGGFLCQIDWTYTFYAYFAAVIFFAVAIAFLPEPEKRVEPAADDNGPKVKAKLPGSVFFYIAVTFLNGMLFYIAVTNTAYVLVQDQIAEPTQIAMMFNALTASSILVGLFFGQMFKALRYHVLTIALALGGIGEYLCGTTYSITVFTVGLALVGITLGGTTSALWAKLGDLVHPSLVALSVSLGISAMNLGEFFQPAIFNLFTVPGRQPFMVGTAMAIVLVVASIVLDKVFPTKESSSITAV